jgi:hypothetical protein
MSEPLSEPEKKPRSCLFTLVKVVPFLLVLLVAVFVGVGYLVLDGKYDVARETTIKTSPEAVHKEVGDLREWPNWLPFIKHDPSVKTTIEQPTGVGAKQHWSGKSGNGELTFTASDRKRGSSSRWYSTTRTRARARSPTHRPATQPASPGA